MNTFEYRDSSQIFHTLPATDEEFWGERKEAPRLLKAAKGLGRTAVRAAGVTSRLLVGSAQLTGQAFMKSSEVLWQSVDTVASHTGVSAENAIRQHASKSTTAAREIADIFKRASGASLRNATDLMDGSNNNYWEKRYSTLANKELTAARKAYGSGDLQSTKQHMQEARTNKWLHGSR